MLPLLEHRGPDDEGVFCKGPVALGIRRLSIIDVGGGHQPIYSEDGSKVVVLNGEIYNYVELREELLKRGHTFATDSDTEVIVHLYEEKGERCIEDLNGMFAFALWDGSRSQLMLARDRLGIKPLHYFVGDGMLLFASEIGALMANKEVDRSLNPQAVADYFTYFYIPGSQSVYRSIRKVPPAHTVIWRQGQASYNRYWQVRYGPQEKKLPLEYYAEAYREQLKRSVRLQLRSDVPLGVFLSGGLDSGSLVAAIAEVTNAPCHTFTVGFSDSSYDESNLARLTSQRYGTEHHEFRIEPGDMIESARLIRHFGEPCGPFTLVQAYKLSQYSREHITVALAGDGGDELFGGYQTYLATMMARHYLRLPKWVRSGLMEPLARALPVRHRLLSLDFKIREFVRGARIFREAGNLAWKIIFHHAEMAQLLRDDFRRDLEDYRPLAYARDLQDEVDPATLLQKSMYGDLAMFLPDCVMTQTDRMSMAASQEVRVPILDHEMVEFAATTPDRYKLRRGRTKVLIRHATKDWLPREVLHKPKTGFSTPIPIWIRNELKGYVQDILSPAALTRTGILNPEYVGQLLAEHFSGRADHARRVWSLVNFMLWHEQCLRGVHARAASEAT